MNLQDIDGLELYLPHGERKKVAEAARCSKVTVDRALRNPRLTGAVAAKHAYIRRLAVEHGAYVKTAVGYESILI